VKDEPKVVAPSKTVPAIKARRTLITQTATQAGRLWAAWWHEEMALQGRTVAGGWPGTLSEARERVAKAMLPQLASSGVTNLSFDENEHAALTLYAIARQQWLERRDR